MKKFAPFTRLEGARRRENFPNLPVDRVKDDGLCFLIVIPFTKTTICREFPVKSGGLYGINIVEESATTSSQEPFHTSHNGFFVFFKNGKRTRQPT